MNGMEEKELKSSMEPVEEYKEPEVTPEFYDLINVSLTDDEKKDFENAMSLDINSSINHPLSRYQKEETFLKHFFMAVGKYKKIIPYPIIEKFYNRYYNLLPDTKSQSRLNNKMISVLYAHKRDDIALQKCIKLCKKDIKMNTNEGNLEGKKLPSLKKLITIYLYLGKYQAAVNLCDTALSLGLIDAKNNGYGERKQKILIKMGILPAEAPVEEAKEEENLVATPAEEAKEEEKPEEAPAEEPQEEQKPAKKEPKTKFGKFMKKRVPTWIGSLIILLLVAAFVLVILLMLGKVK